MKKSVMLLLLLLAVVVSAQDTGPQIPRYSDFPLDNIHILRLQEASTSLGGNVSAMQDDLAAFEERQAAETAEIRAIVDDLKRSVVAQLSGMQTSIDRLTDSVESRQVVIPEYASPAEIKFPPYIVLMIGGNIFLLVLVIILIFWLREQYMVHRVVHKEEHIHPAPKELISYVKHQFQHKRKLHDIRIELASKGWTPSIIEHAVRAAKER